MSTKPSGGAYFAALAVPVRLTSDFDSIDFVSGILKLTKSLRLH